MQMLTSGTVQHCRLNTSCFPCHAPDTLLPALTLDMELDANHLELLPSVNVIPWKTALMQS